MGLRSFAYTNFWWIGKFILRIDKHMKSKLEAALLRFYPEVYASLIGMLFVISLIISIPLTIILYFMIGNTSLFLLSIPLITLLFGIFYPSFKAYHRAFNLEAEVPYAATYISVMATGGISPYKALKRLKDVKLLPNLSQLSQMMVLDVEVTGMDPLSAMEKAGKSIPSRDFKELLLGYASVLNVGGDIVHFLQRKVFTIFENRVRVIKGIADRVTIIMEAYVSVVILLALGLYILFIISKLMPMGTEMFSAASFIVFAYFILPALTIIFLFILDMQQPRYPKTDWRSYKILLFSTPLAIFVFIFMVAPYFINFNSPFFFIMDGFTSLLTNDPNLKPHLALSISMLTLFMPPAIFDLKYSSETRDFSEQMVRFLRDLVEVRKTGLSPERCIQNLADRDYGSFSKSLRSIANKIGWGLSLSHILNHELKAAKDWFSSINIFLLIDSIDVGGGAPKTLEALASFGEQISLLEKEKRSMLKPLILVPYIGGITVLITVVAMLAFVNDLAAIGRFPFPYSDFVMMFLPPVILNIILTGLVAGKTSSERISAGFLHATILAILVIIGLIAMNLLGGIFAPFGRT